MVLVAFVGPRPVGQQACHNNGIPSDCSAGNLRWDSPKANQGDRVAHGTSSRGALDGNSKLSVAQVIEIRRLIADGVRAKSIAKHFGVAPSTVSGIKNGRLWKWMEQPNG